MAEAVGPSVSVRRGVAGALGGAAGAVALVFAITGGYLAVRWAATGATADDRAYDVRDLRERLPVPLVGCSIMAGCAGWAAFAPAHGRRFAWTLWVVFVGSICQWLVIGTLDLHPRHYKGEPLLTPAWVVFMAVPPMVMAAVLTVLGSRRVVGEQV